MKNRLTLVAAAALLGVLGLPAAAQQASGAAMAASSPGKATVARALKISATVEALDVAKRELTVKGPQGKVHTLTVGPDVRNLDQVKVGDSIVVGYLEALSLTLVKDGKSLVGTDKAYDSTRAGAGERPGGAVAEQVKVTADVTAVDAKTQTVTLRGPKQTVDMRVPDPGQFKLIKVGDKIDAVYTQALAISVEPAKKK